MWYVLLSRPFVYGGLASVTAECGTYPTLLLLPDDFTLCERPHALAFFIICSLMVRWVVGSILHGVDPLSYFSFHPVLHDWCYKGRGMCYPVCGMMHIKEPLLLIGKNSLCGSSGFPFSLSEWSLTICLMPFTVNKMC